MKSFSRLYKNATPKSAVEITVDDVYGAANASKADRPKKRFSLKSFIRGKSTVKQVQKPDQHPESLGDNMYSMQSDNPLHDPDAERGTRKPSDTRSNVSSGARSKVDFGDMYGDGLGEFEHGNPSAQDDDEVCAPPPEEPQSETEDDVDVEEFLPPPAFEAADKEDLQVEDSQTALETKPTSLQSKQVASLDEIMQAAEDGPVLLPPPSVDSPPPPPPGEPPVEHSPYFSTDDDVPVDEAPKLTSSKPAPQIARPAALCEPAPATTERALSTRFAVAVGDDDDVDVEPVKTTDNQRRNSATAEIRAIVDNPELSLDDKLKLRARVGFKSRR